jgi:NAD(P)H-hydrate epimerase
MPVRYFKASEIKKLYKPNWKSSKKENGQITIVGGSKLFHGAPILGLKVASRIVDMTFFASPDPSVGRVAELVKSKLSSFIWIPWEDVEAYIQKSDAVLIGPGFMRYGKENPKSKLKNQDESLESQVIDEEGGATREITEKLLKKFPEKRWVIDAGSLQVMDTSWIPKNAILTPNKKEFEILFRLKTQDLEPQTVNQYMGIVKEKAERHGCIIVLKGPETIVASPSETVIVRGGNPGMTKGGTGDVLAGLTTALLAKNDPFLAASAASYIVKFAADEIYKKVGVNYNADDLAEEIPETLWKVVNS